MSNKRLGNKAQAAVEIAVFGAIVIFLVGAILRAGVNNSLYQNQSLKAMRYAMLKSWESAKNFSTSRSNATVIYLEDRLSVDFGKYGAMERVPIIAQGTGSFTNLLFYPLDYHELENSLPMMDIFMNGVHIPLSVGGVKPNQNPGQAGRQGYYELRPPKIEGSNQEYLDWYASPPDPAGNGNYHYRGWNFRCVAGNGGWWGCPLFYTVVANGTPGFCRTEPCSGPLTTLNQRFDLNRNDNYNDDPKDDTRTRIRRLNMSWQWHAYNGIAGSQRGRSDLIMVNPADGSYPQYDIDNDRKEETLYRYITLTGVPNLHKPKDSEQILSAQPPQGRIIRWVTVFDYQEGDVDMSNDDALENPGRVGILQDMAIYTRARNSSETGNNRGTYLEIKEGKLVNPHNRTIVRSVSRRDQVEIVERRIRLSNDTGRFCRNGIPTVWAVGANPVEACGVSPEPLTSVSTCMNADNVAKTCFDKDTKIIFVRSRMANVGGHKWATETAGSNDKWGELKIRE